MGMRTEMQIAAWQAAHGIKPATGREAQLLREMSDAAFELIKVIELHRSGICDGDGGWHGSDVMGGTAGRLVHIIEEYLRASASAPVSHGNDGLDNPWDF
jgi:hypothetical protein